LSGVFGPDGHESAHIINGGAGAEGERNDIEVGLAGGVDTCLVDSIEGDDIVGEESLRGVIIVGCFGGAVETLYRSNPTNKKPTHRFGL